MCSMWGRQYRVNSERLLLPSCGQQENCSDYFKMVKYLQKRKRACENLILMFQNETCGAVMKSLDLSFHSKKLLCGFFFGGARLPTTVQRYVSVFMCPKLATCQLCFLAFRHLEQASAPPVTPLG